MEGALSVYDLDHLQRYQKVCCIVHNGALKWVSSPVQRRKVRVLALSSERRANARNLSFPISVRWSIYIINSVDKPNFRYKEETYLILEIT